MALFNQKEFAEKCGMEKNKINVYVSRGKLVLNEERLIDDSVAQNMDFFIKWSAKPKEEKSDKKKAASSSSKLGSSMKEDIDRTSDLNKRTKWNEELYGLEKRKKAADLNKMEIEGRVALLKEQKLNGTSIPLELTKILVKQHMKSLYSSFSNTIEVFINDLTKKFNMSIEQQAEIKGRMTAQLNADIVEAHKLTDKSLDQVQKEYMAAKQL